MSDDKPVLSPEHRAELEEESGINPDIIEARGYRTITTKATLRRYGFSNSQGGEGPWLFIPIFAPDSDFKQPSGYQIKPTVPRVDNQGKSVKYEFPRGTMSLMDVHPSMREELGDKSEPLYITEGTKKADSAASHGLLALSIPGVWGWKAGQLPHEAWNVIPLQERKVYLAFDSDATTKPGVWDALAALKLFLKKRGAEVKVIVLPVLNEGTKTGLDDFLAQHPPGALMGYTQDDLPERPEDEVQTGLIWRSPDGEILRLANFDARILADIVKDDGMDRRREVELEASLGERSERFVLSVDEFEKMSWNIDHLGSDAILFAGRDIPQKAREVIQAKSIGKEERHVYVHTGWRRIRTRSDARREWVYLNPSGAITASGLAPHIAVDLGDTMDGVVLPDPPAGDSEVQAVRDSLLLVDKGVGVMPLQMYFAIWRASMGNVPFGYWLYGTTGVGKSELAALAQQHWGPELVPAKFMANWMSTENYLNEIAFKAKDMILVVDDFRLQGGAYQEAKMMKTAERLFRSQGNASGRGRMNRDLTLSVGHPVRAMLVSTAEELPEGESLLARMIAEELPKDPERFDVLDIHQTNAVEGQYAKAMSAFLRWYSSRYEKLSKWVKEKVIEERKKYQGKHRRTQEAGAHLMVGANVFLQYAREIDAISPKQQSRLLDRLAEAIREGAMEQSVVQRYQNPVRQARELTLLGLNQQKIHIEGWKDSSILGDEVGWFRDGFFYLRTVDYRGALRRLAKENDVSWNVSAHRFGQSLAEMGWLDEQPSQEGATYTQVGKYDGKTYRVYKLPKSYVTEVEEDPEDFDFEKPEEDF